MAAAQEILQFLKVKEKKLSHSAQSVAISDQNICELIENKVNKIW